MKQVEISVTGKTVAEVIAELERAGVSLEKSVIEYEGCGTHGVVVTFEMSGPPEDLKLKGPRSRPTVLKGPRALFAKKDVR